MRSDIGSYVARVLPTLMDARSQRRYQTLEMKLTEILLRIENRKYALLREENRRGMALGEEGQRKLANLDVKKDYVAHMLERIRVHEQKGDAGAVLDKMESRVARVTQLIFMLGNGRNRLSDTALDRTFHAS